MEVAKEKITKIVVDSLHNQSLKQFIKGLFKDSNKNYDIDEIKEKANENFYFDYRDFIGSCNDTCFIKEILFDLEFNEHFLSHTFNKKYIIIGDKVQETIIDVYEKKLEPKIK